MTLRTLVPVLPLALAFFVLSLTAHAQSPLTTDPIPDKSAAAALETFQLPSHGALLNAFMYTAEGPGPHPTVILLHGFPGNERNLDLAQAIRRAGWNVLYFDYRGSWGTPGTFSFTHCIEDTEAALAWLRDPINAKKLRTNPKSIVLIGHSMGGFIALNVAAKDPAIAAVVSISAANMAGRTLPIVQAHQEQAALPKIAAALDANGLAPLNGCTPPACATNLAKELFANAANWDIPSLAPKLATRPILIISSDDGNTPSAEALATALEKAGSTQAKSVHLATDHSYSDKRIALAQTILDSLNSLHPQ